MQIDFKNNFNNVFRASSFRKLCGALANIVPFTRSFYGVHYSLYQYGWHVEGVIIIESTLGTRHGDPLGGLLFTLTHYQVLLETIMRAPSCVFPSLMNDTHIVKLMNEIICTFDHLLT
jgi:hypothetical protein